MTEDLRTFTLVKLIR